MYLLLPIAQRITDLDREFDFELDVKLNFDDIEIPVVDDDILNVELTDEVGVVMKYPSVSEIIRVQDEDDGNITVDFHRLEYHSLSELHPRLLKFQIATVDGALIEPFDENDNMYMNLQFCFD